MTKLEHACALLRECEDHRNGQACCNDLFARIRAFLAESTPEPKPLDATLEDHGPRSMDQGNEHWRRLLLALEQWRMQSQHPTDFENDKLRVEMVGLQNTIAALTAELAERKQREAELVSLAKRAEVLLCGIMHCLRNPRVDPTAIMEDGSEVADKLHALLTTFGAWPEKYEKPAALAPFSTETSE